MRRTTILADEGLLLEAKYLAEAQGKTLTKLVQEALAEYIEAHRPPRQLPAFVGMGDSGDPLWAGRDEEILAAEIDPIEGWSPGRKARDAQDSTAPSKAKAES